MAPAVRPHFERSWSSRMRDSVSSHRNDILLVLHRLRGCKQPILLQHNFQEALKKASELTPEVLGKLMRQLKAYLCDHCSHKSIHSGMFSLKLQ